jgi:hypothetical protein
MKLSQPKFMKVGTSLIMLLFLVLSAQAQTPQKFNYQAIIRDANGQVLANHTLGLQFSILSGSETGAVAYSERQQVTTHSNGLVTLAIGDGTVVSGQMDNIDWGNNSYFLSVAIDLNNNDNYTNLGVSQLLTVPYAMYAQKAKTVDIPVTDSEKGDIYYYNGSKWEALAAGGENAQLVIKNGIPSWKEQGHYVGELYGGGIVFHVWEKNGVQHGLIASLANIPSTNVNGFNMAPLPAAPTAPVLPSNPTQEQTDAYNAALTTYNTELAAYNNDMLSYTNLFNTSSSHYKGLQNTNNIASFLNDRGQTGMAAQACRLYTGEGYNDWYLPSLDEISILYRSLFAINPILDEDDNSATTIVIGNYWTSTIFNNRQAFYWAMGRGYSSNSDLNGRYYVRPIRQF